ncbi:MAG: hypothetical protein HRT45_10320, partial [Bdellovibrionales bacterium]|nr:hypothetical protein [Bdellovibrionales bacterium]
MKELLSLCCVLGVMVASQMASAAAEESRCHFNDEIWMQEANGGEGACIKAGDAFVTEDGQIIHARLPSEAPAEQDRLQIQVTSGQVEVDCGPKHIYDKIEGSCQPRPSKQPAEMPRRSSETETPSDTEKETTEVDCDEADDSCEAIETAAISGHDEDSTTEAGLPGIDMHLALTGVADGLPLTELEAIKNALLQPSPDDGSTPQLIEDS